MGILTEDRVNLKLISTRKKRKVKTLTIFNEIIVVTLNYEMQTQITNKHGILKKKSPNHVKTNISCIKNK